MSIRGYLNLFEAELFANAAAQEPRAAFWETVKAGSDGGKDAFAAGAELFCPSKSPFVQADTIGRAPAEILARALECGDLRAAAIRADGELVTLPPAAWRRTFARQDDPPREVGWDGYWKRPKLAPPAPTREPFAEALAGRRIPVAAAPNGKPTAWGHPIIARADLARWCDAPPEPEPAERPADWPAPSAPPAAPILPAGAWWTAEQALSWLAFGLPLRWEDAWRAAGTPADDGNRIARAQRQLSNAIAARSLPAWGQETVDIAKPPLRDTLVPIPPEDFAGPSALTVQMNGWAYPPKLPRRYEGRWWQGISFESAAVRRAFPAAEPKAEAATEDDGAAPNRARVASTIAAERRLEEWLAEKMRANTHNPPGKAVIKAEAEAAGHSFSLRAFARAYANAAKTAEAPAWTTAGRKSKR